MTMANREHRHYGPTLPPRPASFGPTPLGHFRWLPRHGPPVCVVEWLAQALVRLTAWLPFYIALVVTLILLVQAWGLR